MMLTIHKIIRQTVLKLGIVTLFATMFAAGAEVYAQGDLMVLPTRVVLEQNKRFEMLTVINRGSDSAQYVISFIEYKMTEKGELQEITNTEAASSSAAEMVRFYPKQVFLAPGESQTVRVQVNKPEGLAAGEYRSHLYFRNVPKENESRGSADTSSLSIRLTPVFGVSVPVIVRQGELSAEVGISDAQLIDQPTGRFIRFMLDRTGTRSVNGEAVIELRTAGSIRQVGSLKGISVYTPLTRREVIMPIELSASERGTLVITYKHKVDNRDVVLATSELNIP